jgi:NADPH2:quinone reductase
VKEPQLPFFRMMYLDLIVRFVIVYSMPETAKKHAIADITQAFAHGMLQHRIAERVPLTEIARANELVEQGGSNGCVVVRID